MKLELATAGRILFGPGTLGELGAVCAPLGRHALLVTGSLPERATPAARLLAAAGLKHTVLPTRGEPTVEMVRAGTAHGRRAGCDLVVAFGGGAVVDAAKAMAALLGNDGDPLDYLEVIGRRQPLLRPPLPFIAVPTTAGAGAEVTKNAVLRSDEHRVKASLRSDLMLPRAAIVDPDLLQGLPRPVIACSGVDALSQVIEPFVSARANPITDGFCREGMPRSARALAPAFRDGPTPGVREDLALASLLGGLALANAGLGAVHGIAGPLGGMLPDAPHGAICAALLPEVMETNLRALEARQPDHPALPRFTEIAVLLTRRRDAAASDGVLWIRRLCAELAIPSLSRLGMTDDQVPELVGKARAASSMKGNPIVLTDDELGDIITRALQR